VQTLPRVSSKGEAARAHDAVALITGNAECFAECTSIIVVGMCRSRAWRSSIILAVKPPWTCYFLAESYA
jgi:hypothetical protein